MLIINYIQIKCIIFYVLSRIKWEYFKLKRYSEFVEKKLLQNVSLRNLFLWTVVIKL